MSETRTRTDTERLNWMAAHCADFCYTQSWEVGAKDWTQQKVAFRVPRHDEYGYYVYDGETIREAIDAGMDAHKDRIPFVYPTHKCFEDKADAER